MEDFASSYWNRGKFLKLIPVPQIQRVLILYLCLHACMVDSLELEKKNTRLNTKKRTISVQIWKRSERSTLESPPSNAEKNVSSKDNDTVEDIAVMDYALPHRKPPIHNKGT